MTTSRPRTPPPSFIEGPLPPAAFGLIGPPIDFALDESLLQGILDSVEDGIYFADLNKQIRVWNRGAELITGFTAAEVLGQPCSNHWLCHVDGSGRLLCTTGCPLQVALERGVPMETEAYLQHKLGHRIPVTIKTRPLRDGRNRLVGAIEIFRSTIGDRRQDELIEELSHLALIDDLTKMPNRRHFDMQLDRHMAELNRFGWAFGLLMIDLDLFKQINDTYGHPTGDDVLRMVGRTLSANCRSMDTVARWGGEEFAAIITNVREDDLRKVAEKFRVMVESSSLRDSSSDVLQVTVSVGGTMAKPNETVADLMKRTDEMLYTAKKTGRNRVWVE
jgi:diguanylate cyclase (GGDEF)-like protein/PAS domain S-box-containing protein